MKILHLCTDGNFIEHSMNIFEHFYPESNIWVILDVNEKNRIIKRDGDNIYWFKLNEEVNYLKAISDLNNDKHFEAVVCHGINYISVKAVEIVRVCDKPKVYWLFWGYELYRPLGLSGKKKIVDVGSCFNPLSFVTITKVRGMLLKLLGRIDEEDILKKFINYADYFCFWFYEDYLLLQRYYPCRAKFRFFQYKARWKDEHTNHFYSERYFKKKPQSIIINHQASYTGNHITILKKLKSLPGIEEFEITSPLSYGGKGIRRYVCWKGKKFFGSKFHPILKPMPLESYNAVVGEMDVALFGQLRQEAAGNISFYLANGTKVFMREENTLFQYFKKAGYVIFSIEKDLNTIDDLTGLTIEDKRYNAELSAKRAKYYEDFMPILLNA